MTPFYIYYIKESEKEDYIRIIYKNIYILIFTKHFSLPFVFFRCKRKSFNKEYVDMPCILSVTCNL